MEDMVRLDISGTMFRTKKSTLQKIPTSRLANIKDSCEEYDRKSGIYIFDRDAVSFRYILNAYINGELHAPKDVCPNQFRRELDFWDIPIKLLSLVIVLTIWTQVGVRVDLYIEPNTNAVPNYTYFNMPIEIKTYLEHEYSPILLLLGLTDPHPALLAVDVFCMAVFIVELIVHFCACPSKSQHLRSKFNVAKILLCICMITASGLEMNKSLIFENNQLLNFCLIVKSISVFRLIFIFRLRKLYKDFDLLLLSISHSFSELVLLLFSFSILVIVYGTIMLSTELVTDKFKNPLYAMWWALVTMTTVGYGDFYPTTTLSYFVGGVCAVNGLIVIALPTAAIASNFSLFYSRNGFLKKHMNAVRQGCENSNTRNGDMTEHLNVLKIEHEKSNMSDLTKHLNGVKQES
ncbi:potassium voltage-gated channel protein Shaw-like [Dreissena polymorpha]|uniref:potassium voltage-gated channel protein Shaw-like n=1 Tax=Dreissena polymorpha TaxID=45954 RepID=UPI002263C989|nr:potassium voltage-gated channel protein Shaw-like [Dreissena polymorpha]